MDPRDRERVPYPSWPNGLPSVAPQLENVKDSVYLGKDHAFQLKSLHREFRVALRLHLLAYIRHDLAECCDLRLESNCAFAWAQDEDLPCRPGAFSPVCRSMA